MTAGDLQGKSAIVTGGGHGIGFAVAGLLAKHGASVVIAEISETAGRNAEEALNSAGGTVKFVKTDVSKKSDVQSMIDIAVSLFGGVDIAINNAGVIRLTSLLRISEEEWDLVVDVNLKGTFLCSQIVVPEMVRRGGGVIVNTASPVIQRALADCGHYIAAKAGVAALTRAMALEWGPLGIRVNCVIPGPTETSNEMMWPSLRDDEIPAARRDVEQTVPLGRMGQPEDVARASVWLCTAEAAFITGAILPVDGGAMTLHRGHVPRTAQP